MRRFARLLVALALAMPAGAYAEHSTSFESSGRCTELWFSIPVEAERMRRFVPDSFAIRGEATGVAQLNVFAEECETSLDGGPLSSSVVTGLLTPTDASRSPGGCAAYDFRWTNDREDVWYQAHHDLGWTLGLSESTFVETALTPAAYQVDVAVGDAEAPWSARAIAGRPASLPETPFDRSVHCFLGARGLVRGTYDHDCEANAAAAQVVIGEGPIWGELGVNSGTVPALLFRFTWTGTTEIVPGFSQTTESGSRDGRERTGVLHATTQASLPQTGIRDRAALSRLLTVAGGSGLWLLSRQSGRGRSPAR